MDSFFGIGITELFFIAILALIFLGPERLPGTIREVMKWLRYIRNLSQELSSQFSEEFKALEDVNPQRILKELGDQLEADAEVKKGQPKGAQKEAGQGSTKAAPKDKPVPAGKASTAAGAKATPATGAKAGTAATAGSQGSVSPAVDGKANGRGDGTPAAASKKDVNQTGANQTGANQNVKKDGEAAPAEAASAPASEARPATDQPKKEGDLAAPVAQETPPAATDQPQADPAIQARAEAGEEPVNASDAPSAAGEPTAAPADNRILPPELERGAGCPGVFPGSCPGSRGCPGGGSASSGRT
ncbi:MAG: hypothetical protein KatS3mg050_3299 [Litorilinea sp.]|nr:MAG: hypothetical protein KatS3mg050_3299 [Litorilinea sp.]